MKHNSMMRFLAMLLCAMMAVNSMSIPALAEKPGAAATDNADGAAIP